nr:helix-turn-helix domain-containing protein [Jongsikchunia kroppenstedtii]
MSGVRPGDTLSAEPVDVSSADPLLDAARPVLDEAATRLSGTDVSLLLVDHECRMVSRVAFGTTVERALDRIGAAPGVPFAEDAVGTNALGTPAETRGGIAINSSEHYLEQLKSVSCFGQPIIHPATRRLAGIICMTEVADRINPLAVPLVNELVTGIADRLLDRSRAHQRRVLDAFQRAAGRRDIGVAAIGDDLQLTNAMAASLLSPTDVGALRALAGDPHQRARVVPLTLVSGVPVEIRVEPVVGVRGAALFRLRPADGPMAIPVVSAASATVHSSLSITGEPGTGRTTHALAAAADYPGSPPVVVDVAGDLIAGAIPDIPARVTDSRDRGVPLIIDGADLLDDRSITLLASAIATATSDAPIIVVSGPRDRAGSEIGALLARCTSGLELAPLRHRSADLGALAAAALARHDDDVTLSGAATDALLSQDWPGNFVELHAVLREAVRTTRARASRVIEAADLPAAYRTTSRVAHLSGREQAERAAIIKALDRAGGNKVHAARELGISRTTLYSRMHALDV